MQEQTNKQTKTNKHAWNIRTRQLADINVFTTALHSPKQVEV